MMVFDRDDVTFTVVVNHEDGEGDSGRLEGSGQDG